MSRFEPPPGGPGSVGGPGTDAGTLPALEPQLARLSVHFQDAQTSALVLEIHGTGFRASSRVTFDGVDRAHQLVSDSLVRVALTAADVGTRQVVRVVNPAAEGGSSDPVAQPLGWPVPAVATLSPLELRVGELPSSLRVTKSPRPRTSPTSSTGQMCGWPRADAASASRRSRSPAAASLGAGRSSSATRLSSRRSRAL